MPTQKTRPSDNSVDAFLAGVEPAERREEALRLRALLEGLSGQPARLWGGRMIGFGSYRYRYDSGHSGESLRTGFAVRKTGFVIYVMDGFDAHADAMSRLGKYTTGKACLYLKRLSDVDEGALASLLTASLSRMRERFPEGA